MKPRKKLIRSAGGVPYCLGPTRDGHPLYMPASATPEVWEDGGTRHEGGANAR